MQARFKRVVLAASIIAAFGTMLAYVGLASGGGKIAIAEFYYNPSPYGIASYKSAQIEAGKVGVTLTTFDGNNVPQTQTTQMEDAITTGKYKGFWVWALDGVSLAPTIKQAEAKHIKVAVADYTLGSLQSQVHLSPTPGLVSTIGGSIGKQEAAFVALIKLACTKQVGSGTCNVAFMPGLANYPTDTLREQYMQAQFASGNIHLTLTPPGMYDQPTSQQVALTYFQAKPDVQVFGSFGDQMTAGAMTAFKQLGIVPGKDIQVLGSGGTNETDALIKSGSIFGTVALYPSDESYVGIKSLVTAIKGGKVPSIINVINKCHPLIIDAAVLKSTPCYKPDWSLTGAAG
ncbi:MAG TPA: sugar ABC transporter substrate-binding protein [Solirubrobacteraceae bacterium]|jgi:ribose transport system substrate-binding protein